MLCIIREGDGDAFWERYTYAAVTRAWDGQCQFRKASPATSVEIFVAEPKEEARGKGCSVRTPRRLSPDPVQGCAR